MVVVMMVMVVDVLIAAGQIGADGDGYLVRKVSDGAW